MMYLIIPNGGVYQEKSGRLGLFIQTQPCPGNTQGYVLQLDFCSGWYASYLFFENEAVKLIEKEVVVDCNTN